jgi:hypothetical protein
MVAAACLPAVGGDGAKGQLCVQAVRKSVYANMFKLMGTALGEDQ